MWLFCVCCWRLEVYSPRGKAAVLLWEKHDLWVWECVRVLGASLFSVSIFSCQPLGFSKAWAQKHLRQFRCLSWRHNCHRLPCKSELIAFGFVIQLRDQRGFPRVGWSNKIWFICSVSSGRGALGWGVLSLYRAYSSELCPQVKHRLEGGWG